MTQTWNINNEEGLERAKEELARRLREGEGLTITLSADIPDNSISDKGAGAKNDPESDYPWRSCMAYE
jgi:hypothetical protein